MRTLWYSLCALRTLVRKEDTLTDFRGSYTVQVTPFSEDGLSLDLDAQRRFIDWQVAESVPGLIILGTSGEFYSVSDTEREAFVAATIEHVAGRFPVLVGAAHPHTPTAVRFARQAVELGAAGLMISPPYYLTPTDDEVFGYYRAICDAVDVPIMLYNNPFTARIDMSAELVARLVRSFEQIRYIKEASTDVGRVFDIVTATDGVMNVFAGERITESFLLGAVGYVNPFGNYAPRASARIWDLLVAGRVDEARRIQVLLDRIDHTIAEGHPLYGYQCYSKALAAAAGYPLGDVRAPLTPFRELGQAGVDRVAVLKWLIDEANALADEFTTTAAAT
jgi:4-hydroxy-tetrahydrodipicolinate synthase